MRVHDNQKEQNQKKKQVIRKFVLEISYVSFKKIKLNFLRYATDDEEALEFFEIELRLITLIHR